MSKFIYSLISNISKVFLFITFFLLLTVSFLTKENPHVNNNEKNLRRLDTADVFLTIFKIYDYLFFPFLVISFFSRCIYLTETEGEEDKIMMRNLGFFINKICYIINIGFLITSGTNFICGVQFDYSLTVFIFASLNFLVSSIIYITSSVKEKDMCFPGICQWGYLGNLYSAPCFFNAPCKEKECRDFLKIEGDCCNCFCCCFCFITALVYICNLFNYYIGLIVYSLFWMIGKFFVHISCCDCWLKEEYNMDNFKFTSVDRNPLTNPETDEDREVKKAINKVFRAFKKNITESSKKK